MPRVTRAAGHLSAEEVKARKKSDPRAFCRGRWLIIYNALVAPRTAQQIATHCGVWVHGVHQVVSRYNRFGQEAIETAGKGGRHREYLTVEEERQGLAPFFARAARGEIATTAEIQQAFEEQVGHQVDDSTIYRLLNRYGWRKLVPRARPPKASQEEPTRCATSCLTRRKRG